MATLDWDVQCTISLGEVWQNQTIYFNQNLIKLNLHDSHRNEPQARDKGGRIVNPFPDVKEILVELKQSGIELGVASRTPEIKGARKLMETLDWDKYISFKEIYPGCKTTHFENLSKHSRIPYNEMLFFDDEDRNIKDITAIGVVCVLVDDRGVTRKTVREGLLKFEKERSGAKEVQSKWGSNLIRSNKPKAVQQIPCSSLNFYVIYFVCFKSISTF